ncbi:MAG: flagellar FlbD family protein [Actinobacteria bacterium]|nr:flagellar FlbD family protein [Actinomycetota bacterium]
MIELHRLDNTTVLINLDLIENVEGTPDTVVTLVNGNKYIVKEKISEIVEKILDFKSNVQFKRFAVVEDIKSRIVEDIKNEVTAETKAKERKTDY